jgi:hypothetical protein
MRRFTVHELAYPRFNAQTEADERLVSKASLAQLKGVFVPRLRCIVREHNGLVWNPDTGTDVPALVVIMGGIMDNLAWENDSASRTHQWSEMLFHHGDWSASEATHVQMAVETAIDRAEIVFRTRLARVESSERALAYEAFDDTLSMALEKLLVLLKTKCLLPIDAPMIRAYAARVVAMDAEITWGILRRYCGPEAELESQTDRLAWLQRLAEAGSLQLWRRTVLYTPPSLLLLGSNPQRTACLRGVVATLLASIARGVKGKQIVVPWNADQLHTWVHLVLMHSAPTCPFSLESDAHTTLSVLVNASDVDGELRVGVHRLYLDLVHRARRQLRGARCAALNRLGRRYGLTLELRQMILDLCGRPDAALVRRSQAYVDDYLCMKRHLEQEEDTEPEE